MRGPERIEALRGDLATLGGGGPHVERLRGLLATSRDVFSRYHYVPGHVTGSAFVVHPDGNAIALVHHDKLDLWVQPGGHVEPDDLTVESGARREVAEEIGVTHLDPRGIIDVDIHTFPARGDQPTHLHFDVRYLFRAAAETMTAGEGVRAVRWVPVEEALRMDDSIARAVERITAPPGW